MHLQCLLGQLVALWWLIYYCNAETNEIFAFHHPIWMNQNKAHWAEPQRRTLCCHYSSPLPSVFNAWALEASPCIIMPSGKRFRLHSPSMFFEVLQVKGTKATLTTWHCFDCLTKKRVCFNFSLVSGVIKQAVSIFADSYPMCQELGDCSGEEATLWSQARLPDIFSTPPQSSALQLLQLPGAVCV